MTSKIIKSGDITFTFWFSDFIEKEPKTWLESGLHSHKPL